MKNEHAFPHIHVEGSVLRVEGGLSKREYFAGQALFAHLWLNRNVKHDTNLAESIAKDALACADALIAELEKTK